MDLNRVISGLTSSGVLGGFAGGALGGALMSNKKARKSTSTLLKLGGVAALGTVAWKAYQGYQAQQPASDRASNRLEQARGGDDPAWKNIPRERFEIGPGPDANESRAVLLIRAMIAAACADGHLDASERAAILNRVDDMGLAAEENVLVFDALQAPPSQADIAACVDSPELAIEVYASSLVALDRSRRESEMYLEALAFRLGLPESLVAELHREWDATRQPALQETRSAA